MRSISWLTFLLGTVAFVEIAHALVCFSCEGEASNWKCLRMITCPEGAQNCLTIGSRSGNDSMASLLITKMCSQSCPTLSEKLRRRSSSVYCCGHSWCNFWGPR
ncbi:hypothetical protein lerEdw1_014413 [Lerista edwardsae]|nr:hypothetical protein lerEdw1_014413 [Lerista edwardsae]